MRVVQGRAKATNYIQLEAKMGCVVVILDVKEAIKIRDQIHLQETRASHVEEFLHKLSLELFDVGISSIMD